MKYEITNLQQRVNLKKYGENFARIFGDEISEDRHSFYRVCNGSIELLFAKGKLKKEKK